MQPTRPVGRTRLYPRRQHWPLCLYAATGALAGALAALSCSPFRLRLLHVLYLSALIADCALRFDRLGKISAAHGVPRPVAPRCLPRLPRLLNACALLAMTALAGMRLATPFSDRLPERARVGLYMSVLLAVLFKMTT